MDALAFDLKTLALRSADGSFLTRNQRHRGLQLMARELAALGYKLPSARSLKPKHIHALVNGWKATGLSAGTLKNRTAWLRWWTEQVRKNSVMPRDNVELGIESRVRFNGNKAHTTTTDKLATLPAWMQCAIRLQMGLGLRLEESLKFRPELADQGHLVQMHATWCKGGRAREIPLSHPRQRELLDDVHGVAGDGSLIPAGMSYIQARKALERATWGLGIRNMHGHRHWYAQWRYEALTGRKAPAAGGKTYENLTAVERAADYRARMAVSRELGHNRIEITDAYLGRRFAGKDAANAR
jgi:integrase